ncbi:host attachment protein [Pseudoduganella umbonata]|uniref:Host attachment protein n=1 Tax=Pseudoduganella umbonata TaxID=864828 RepID=A0A4V1EE33_9BURK|nr:host attachment protein [Pseudoduganella umbonata]MBB3223086.1 protein required for attachment to host cells [Pseudoduganella umbonata]QCP13181.1 host attachment protein [Pseudoduganella umbonata]
MKPTWIITANAGRARIFEESALTEPLQEIEDMVSPGARQSISDVMTDQAGPTAAAKSSHNIGSGNQAPGIPHNANSGAPNKQYQPAVTPNEAEAVKFAKDISSYLSKAHQEGRFAQLVISASPQFLGTLRTVIDPQLKDLIKTEFNKDYTHFNGPQLREQLQALKDKQE